MPCTKHKGRNEIKLEDVWNARVIFSKKTRKGFLPKYGSGKGSQGRLMPIDVKVR